MIGFYTEKHISLDMPDETMLMEFEVEKSILLKALDFVSNVETEIAIGVLGDSGSIDNGIYHGIVFNRGVNVPNSGYRTMHYVHCPISDLQMRHFKVHVKKWPLVFFSCTDRLVRAVHILSPKTAKHEAGDDYLRVTISQIEVDSDNVESHVIIHGAGGANVGSRIWHPISPDVSVESGKNELAETFCHYA